MEVGGTNRSLSRVSFSTRFASSETRTELPEPNSERDPESPLLLRALSMENDPNPSSSFFLDFFEGAGFGFVSLGAEGVVYVPAFFASATSFRTWAALSTPSLPSSVKATLRALMLSRNEEYM